MRNLLLAGLLAVSTTIIIAPVPAEARGWNCYWVPIYGPDIDIDGDSVADPNSGQILGYTRYCEVEMDEVTPQP